MRPEVRDAVWERARIAHDLSASVGIDDSDEAASAACMDCFQHQAVQTPCPVCEVIVALIDEVRGAAITKAVGIVEARLGKLRDGGPHIKADVEACIRELRSIDEDASA